MSVAPSLFTFGARIGLSPWSARTMDPDERDRLEARAEALGVVVSTFHRQDRSWMVRVHKGHVTVALVGSGPLAAVIAGALDDWEAAA